MEVSDILSYLKDLVFQIPKAWDYTLFNVDQRPIAVANIVIGLLLIAVGHWVSKNLTLWFSNKLLPRFNMPLAQQATIRSVVFYFLLTFTTLFALNMANVPLTTFALLGGAIAIGIGFGSQNVVNNFMSGLILMIEQPVKVGDIIELDGLRGVIEHIGARSTRIRSFTNTHIIVPNSSFIEKNVVNWTLTDDVVLISVEVGVSYGSPTEKVKSLLNNAVQMEPKVLKKPVPVILFKSFGDNALIFEVFFGVNLKNHMERRKLESRIRFNVDRLFAENNITIAFPQRDIHIDSTKPIEVKMLNT